MILESGADVPRPKQRRGPSTRAGSIRSTVRQGHSAKVRLVQLALAESLPATQIARGSLLLRNTSHIESSSNNCDRLRRAMPNRNPEAIALDHAHCRAICDEIGERLREVLKPEALEIPQRLRELLDRLAQMEQAPSIVPSLDEISAPRRRDRVCYAVNRSGAACHQSQISFCRFL